jgi:calcineurin-like phosphoesterase family protein
MKRVWVTADLHLSHKNIIKYESRPFTDLKEMEQVLISNINELVGENDILWNLGDFAFCGATELARLVSLINCKDHRLIRGNHDDGHSQKWYLSKGFSFYSKYPLIYKNILLSHEPQNSFVGLNIHGHIHNNPDRIAEHPFLGEQHKCVCVERTEYKPVLLGFYEDRKTFVPTAIM